MMGRSKPRIEPLPRAAWERVEARLFERLDRGEHRAADARPSVLTRPVARLWAGVATLAAAAAFALWWHAPASVLPAAIERAAGDQHVAAAPRADANEGTQIVTTSAPTRTTMGEATLTLAAASEVHVAGSDAEGWLVRLDRGEVECEVAPRHGRPPFVVQAGETRVTVVGTRFQVIRDGGAARVSVREGHVEVRSGAQRASLGPGESWPAEPAVSALDEPPALDAAPGRHRAKRRVSARSLASEQFARAARLEATDPDAAIRIYRELVKRKGPWAANALYAEARLELERGRRQRARRLLRQYLARHPSGANGSDVRALLDGLEGDRR